MLKDKNGNRLFRKVEVRVNFPDNIFPSKVLSNHAGPKQGYSEVGIDEILMTVATRLDELYPWWDFKYIELKPVGRTARYVFNFVGYNSSVHPPEVHIDEFTKDTPIEDATSLQAESGESTTPTDVGNTL